MSEDVTKLQVAYDALVEGFVAPLVAGKEAVLGRPVAPGALTYFATARPGSAEAENTIYDGLHRMASEIAPIDDVPWPSRDLVAMAMALHDLAFLTDPELDGLFARGARPVLQRWIDTLTEAIAPPRTRGEALARHALLEAFLGSRRKDETVKNWAYTYRFPGRPVPWNVVAMPTIRFVRREEKLVDVSALLVKSDERADLRLVQRLRALVARSPVTELVYADRYPPACFGYATLAVLSDRALRGGIARVVAGRSPWRAASALGRALAHPSLASAPPEYAALALSFLLEVHLSALLDVRGDLRHPDALDEGAARYAAVLPAHLEDAKAIDALRTLDDADRALLQRQAAKLAKLVPRPVMESVAALVRRAGASSRAGQRAAS